MFNPSSSFGISSSPASTPGLPPIGDKVNRPDPVDENFPAALRESITAGPGSGAPDSERRSRLAELFDSQAGSRHLDFAARRLGAEGVGFYSIGSAGHESNAAVAAALRPTDPALLHYRSGGFYLQRARQVPGQQPLRDVLLGVVASAEEPMSAGRHKVFGNAELSVIPQTSTIASHLPRAVGLAFALDRRARLGLDGEWPQDAVVVCSFGDASANHSTAAGAISTAVHCAYQSIPMPLLLVCEDNGIGISVPTPGGWIEHAYGSRPGLRWFGADGTDPLECVRAATEAADWVREHRRPAFLHLRTVRLMGHAGSDVESGYRSTHEIGADLARDPLVHTGRHLVDAGAPVGDVLAAYEAKRQEVADVADEVVRRPKLAGAHEVMSAIVRCDPAAARRDVLDRAPAEGEPLTLAQAINRTLAEELARDRRVLVFGEDVARKGGVYGVTRGLRGKYGAARVFDTLLDEQSILGTALGAGLAGMLPVPEIQYLAYVHNAADQLRGEAATLGFFSDGRYRNPAVLRIAGYGYQRGFGGHFHNDNSVAALRDLPGVIVASPALPDDAAAVLRTCLAEARNNGSVCVFLEPIALYHTRDLHESGDGGWLAAQPDPSAHVPVGSARVHGDGTDLALVTFGNGLAMSLRVAHTLHQRGIRARVLDLRWLSPLPIDDLLDAARATGAVLVVDETRRSGGVSESVLAVLADNDCPARAARVTSEDSFIPLGTAARHVLLDETAVLEAAVRLVGG